MTTTTTLYRFYDDTGALLYVGISKHALRRLTEHQTGQPWWSEVARSTMEHFDTREEAAEAELVAIRTEGPLFNIAGATLPGRCRLKPTSVELERLGDWCDVCAEIGADDPTRTPAVVIRESNATLRADYVCEVCGHRWPSWWAIDVMRGRI